MFFSESILKCILMAFFFTTIIFTTKKPLSFPKIQDGGHEEYNANTEVGNVNTDDKPVVLSLNKWTMFLFFPSF